MCGINGIFAYRPEAPPVDEAELLRTREAMRNRGPDGEGLWTSADRRVGLGHRRLAIIDTSAAGSQPMASADGRLRIVFNGEIYNHAELRRELEGRGHAFRSRSDTEVLLHLYADRGADMVHALRGMFAFALWDEAARSLLLARDAFGIKPLYYAQSGGVLRFASQVKALLAGGAVDDAPEPAGRAGFLLWGFVPEPWTLHRGIRALPAGTTLAVGADGAGVPRPWFELRGILQAAQESARPFREDDRPALAAALADSVRHHLVADVPVAVFLSAGVDSTLVAALAARAKGGGLRAFTLGFAEYRGTPADETALAARVAAALAAHHAIGTMDREAFAGDRGALLAAMDQPSTDGVNTWLVCREAAREGIKVALSGLGGDELCGGYASFRQVPRLARALRAFAAAPRLGRLLRRAARPLLPAGASPKLAGLAEYGGSVPGAYLLRRALHMPWELEDVLDPVAVHVGLQRLATVATLRAAIEGLRGAHAQVAALETAWYMRNQLLRDADWAGMAHAVEVRVPLVDAVLWRTIAPWLASGVPPRKADFAACVAAPHWQETLARPKTGFSVPVRDWVAGVASGGARGLRGWARSVLPDQPRQFRSLVLASDAFGGQGGIAQYTRHFVAALAAMPECAEVVLVTRHGAAGRVRVPERVRVRADGTAGKAAFVRAAVRAAGDGPYGLVVAGHLHFAVLARTLASLKRARSLLLLYGIDAWNPHRSPLVRRAAARMDAIVAISRLTARRFAQWSAIPEQDLRWLPPCLDPDAFAPGPRSEALARELGLEGRTVLMTLGRLAGDERSKGYDEVIEALPALLRERPDLAYLVCGDGTDRARLQAKAAALGVADRVVFAGLVPEARKPDYYRLADAFVMPSRAEGFGIVFLEALASGIPVVGGAGDGGREALLDGALGELVDPDRGEDVRRGILAALRRGKGVPAGLAQFSAAAYGERLGHIVRDALAARGSAP